MGCNMQSMDGNGILFPSEGGIAGVTPYNGHKSRSIKTVVHHVAIAVVCQTPKLGVIKSGKTPAAIDKYLLPFESFGWLDQNHAKCKHA